MEKASYFICFSCKYNKNDFHNITCIVILNYLMVVKNK